MDLRVFRYFLTVAHEENITKAAEILHITQLTVAIMHSMQTASITETAFFIFNPP